MSRFDPLRSTSAERLVSGVLTNTTTTNAISSAYYANRLLDFRKRITAPKQNLRIPGVASEPSDIDVDLAWELIQEIEQAEKTRLQDLDEGQVSKYIVALSKAVGQRTRREYNISARTKRELVKKVMSRVMTLTPKDHDVLGNTDSIAEFKHGTIVTIKPKQGKKSSAKRRAWMEGLPAGRPKKSHKEVSSGYPDQNQT
jgi:hypothetical protein